MLITPDEINRKLRNLRLALKEAHQEEDFQRRRAIQISQEINEIKRLAREEGTELK